MIEVAERFSRQSRARPDATRVVNSPRRRAYLFSVVLNLAARIGESAMIHTILSAEDFRQALANNAKVVVYCQVERDPECQGIKGELDRLAEGHADVSFFALDLDTVRDAVAQELDDRVDPPSYYLFLDGKRIDVVRGAAQRLAEAMDARF